jgi:hypothetical protein
VQRRAFGPERHELLVSLHYTFKMLQTCAGEAAGRLPAPEAHSHHFKVLSEMYSCLPADVKCALVYPSFELRACRGGTRPRRQTAVLWDDGASDVSAIRGRQRDRCQLVCG